MYTFNAFSIPGFAHFYGTEEHFVHAEGVGAVFITKIIWVYSIKITLTHFFNFNIADIFAVFQNEFRILIFCSPFLEGFYIQLYSIYKTYINMQFEIVAC